MLTINKKIQICIFINFLLLVIVCGLVLGFGDSSLLRIGYSKDLIVIGVVIDTLDKYLVLHCCIFFIEFWHAIIYEYANPIMYFNVFNADKKVIEDFSRMELQVYAQSLWFLTTVKNGLMILVAITQIDITLGKIIYNEIAVAIVIRGLLKDKVFVKRGDSEDKLSLLDNAV